MSIRHPGDDELDPKIREFYADVLSTLTKRGVDFLVGGGFGLDVFTGVSRHTKDIDVFVRPECVDKALQVLADVGYRTEITYEHWIGKAFHGELFVDIIYNSGNGVCPVDDSWFEHAPESSVFGIRCKVCPAEETIWQKSFIMERERYDGADVAHLLRSCGSRLDWRRLIDRYGQHWRVLLSHLILFGFIYPKQSVIPQWVMKDLFRRLEHEMEQGSTSPPNRCLGTLLSLFQYKIDVDQWGYEDGRLQPTGNLTPDQLIKWRLAIEKNQGKE